MYHFNILFSFSFDRETDIKERYQIYEPDSVESFSSYRQHYDSGDQERYGFKVATSFVCLELTN